METLTDTTLLQGLNPEQLAAVTYPPQAALVLAGAGSGKTRVLTTRIAWLLQTHQASVHSILAVTFTNKAAKEMQTRLSAMLPISVRAMWLGTFHGLCHRFLRLHYREALLPKDFQILDSGDQLSLIKRLLKNLNIAETVLAPRSLQGFINAQKEAGLRAGQLQADSSDPHSRKMIECYAAYDEICQREGVVDFAELMLRSFELLSNNAALRTHYQNRFNHILVDEFQDTNKLQYAWLKLLAGEHAAVFAVGDDDQSIYRFRGANVGNMTTFLREFQAAAPIKLEQNYRSDGYILIAANAVIAHNAERLGKDLRTDANVGEKIRFLAANNDGEEAQFVVDEAKTLHREGIDYAQMAVLYRSNAQSRILEQTLFRAGVPYKIYGGLRFYERQEIKHALAYLRLAINPHDDNALLRVINVPARGIGTRTVENIQAAATDENISLWQSACAFAKKQAKVSAFIHIIKQLQEQAQTENLPQLMTAVIHDSGLMAHYRNQKGEHQERIDNLEELVNSALVFNPHESSFFEILQTSEAGEALLSENEIASPTFAAQAFLSNAALESGEHQAENGKDAVQLMTIHAAKGLEFTTVFLTGMEEGLFPSEYSLAERKGLEEERRLMYVAITRARKRLYISMAQQRMLHGQTHFGVPSRFVDEIPAEVLHPLSPRKNTAYHSNSQPVALRQIKQLSNTPATGNPLFGGFYIGQIVRHDKFGTGVIIDALSKGESAKLTINFGKQGIKNLDSAFAKLEAV
ncbi:UvrD-helicase domain-containing protein [Stenoxybacter acetivorans]|uniref:UvrD-helicase domain-containing protein n=1 Tax=Stenoxybacter acetivorans TaxID=422441 RepID=UPI00056B95F7|nr:UvrD-helicase domain-containing protein [Stenoxybacter acetivorans]